MKNEIGPSDLTTVRQLRDICQILIDQNAGDKPIIVETIEGVTIGYYDIGQIGYHGEPSEPEVKIKIRNKIG